MHTLIVGIQFFTVEVFHINGIVAGQFLENRLRSYHLLVIRDFQHKAAILTIMLRNIYSRDVLIICEPPAIKAVDPYIYNIMKCYFSLKTLRLIRFPCPPIGIGRVFWVQPPS